MTGRRCKNPRGEKPRLGWRLAQNLVRLLWWFDVFEAYVEAVGRSREGLPELVWRYNGQILQGMPQRPATVSRAMHYIERLARWKLGAEKWPEGW